MEIVKGIMWGHTSAACIVKYVHIVALSAPIHVPCSKAALLDREPTALPNMSSEQTWLRLALYLDLPIHSVTALYFTLSKTKKKNCYWLFFPLKIRAQERKEQGLQQIRALTSTHGLKLQRKERASGKDSQKP